MAQLHPSDLAEPRLSSGETAELRTLDLLRRGLPGDYTVYHSVHWSQATASRSVFGEADFVVANRSGEAIVVEQKAGALEETGAGLAKRYAGQAPKPVEPQITRTLNGLRSGYRRQSGRTLQLDYLFYCPDHRVLDRLGSALDPERIVDATGPDLCERIRALLGPGTDGIDGERAHRYFANAFHLVPDIHAHRRAGERTTKRMVAGLSDAVGAIEMTPMRLRVRGTAGCGKSTVALAAAERAAQAGGRVLLVCFNRSLAEKLKAAAPPDATVTTFHGLVDRFLEACGAPLDHGRMGEPGFWTGAQEKVIAQTVGEDWTFDTLIVDEGQDFDAEWFDILSLFLAPGAAIVWLEDADQAIRYGLGPRDALDERLEGFVGYRTRANFRSPLLVADAIRDRLPMFEFEAANPLPGLGVGHHAEPVEKQSRRVAAIVSDLLKQGFRHEDIVVLSLRGVSGATLSGAERVGNFTLRRPTGTYDLLGNQEFTSGQIRFETIHRFKGQEAPAVILTDVTHRPDGGTEPDLADRLMFAAMTRATVRLDVVETL